MKKGKWNYTEDILYKVILVKVLPVSDPPMSWQNAFAGEERQVVEVVRGDYKFYIDNQDGSGLRKIERGGGPDSYSAHLGEKRFQYIRELSEYDWQVFDTNLHAQERSLVDKWQKEHFPEEFGRMDRIREMMQSGDYHIDEKGTIQPGRKEGRP